MKVTLVHGKYFNSWEALGLGYIASYVKKTLGTAVELDFYQGCFDDEETIVNGAKDSDIVCFSCTTPAFPHALSVAGQLKAINSDIHTVVGGYHASALPAQSLVPGLIDQVVIGEGELAMVDIINGNRTPLLDGQRAEFNVLPWPDRTLIRNERTVDVAFEQAGERITAFQSHRACPFRCKYCLDGAIKALYPSVGRKDKAHIAYRDIDDLLSEIESVSDEYQLDMFKFSDPTWNTSIPWVEAFCKRKIERGIQIPYYPAMHTGLITAQSAHLMKASGCYEVAVGVESGSPKVLREIGKGTSVKSIKRGVKYLQDAGIVVRGYFILGMPNETEDDIRLTEKLAEELELYEYGFTILCPYPGTTMYDPQRHANIDWNSTDEYGNDFWYTEHLSNEQLHQWQAYLVDKFSDNICWHNKIIANNNYDLNKTMINENPQSAES